MTTAGCWQLAARTGRVQIEHDRAPASVLGQPNVFIGGQHRHGALNVKLAFALEPVAIVEDRERGTLT